MSVWAKEFSIDTKNGAGRSATMDKWAPHTRHFFFCCATPRFKFKILWDPTRLAV